MIAATLFLLTTIPGAVQTPSPPPAAAGDELVVRCAFLVGSRSAATAPAPPPTAGVGPGFLGEWDPTADNPDLTKLLALRQIRELGRFGAVVRVGGEAAGFAGAYKASRYEVSWRVLSRKADVLILGGEAKRDGVFISAPQVVVRLKTKAMLGTTDPDGALLFFVVQLDEPPGSVAPQAAAQPPQP